MVMVNVYGKPGKHGRLEESFAFSVLMNFFTDPDPRIRIRVRVTPNSFRKNLNMIFLEEKADPRVPLSGFVHVFTF